MKVVFRHIDNEVGAYAGDIEPDRISATTQELEVLNFCDSEGDHEYLVRQIVVEGNEVFLEVIYG